jgi:PKD repeat protein
MKTKLSLLITALIAWSFNYGQLANDNYTININTATTFNVTANDNMYHYIYYNLCGIDSSNITIADYPGPYGSLTSEQGGDLVFNNNNTITYTPPLAYIGIDHFYYGVSNGTGTCDTAFVTVNIYDSINCTNSNLQAFAALTDTLVINTSISNQITLGGSPSATGGYAPYSYSWINLTAPPSGGTLNSTSISNPLATVGPYDVYVLTVIDSNGCMAKDTVVIDTVYSLQQNYPCTGKFISFTHAPSAQNNSYVYFQSNYNATGISTSTYWSINGNTVSQNPNDSLLVSDGDVVCFWVVEHYIDSNNYNDSCELSFCDTFNILTDSTLPFPIIDSSCNLASDFTSTTNGLTATFTNTTSVITGGTWFEWSFGDGNTSNLLNPIHTYATAGNYIVRLNAYDTRYDSLTQQWDSCYSYECHVINVVDSHNNPCAGHSLSFTSNIIGNSITLTASYTGYNSNNITWYENGLIIGTGVNLSITRPFGTYVITAYAYDTIIIPSACQISVVDTIVINSNSNPCAFIPDFGYTPSNYSINFIDLSSTVPVGAKYFWNFGDGNTSNQQNPTHQYASNGNYNVCLYITVNDSNCNPVCIKHECENIIVGNNSPCDSNDYVSYTSSVVGNVVTLTATHSGFTNINWTNGGVAIGSGNPLIVTLPTGTHNICVEARKIVYDSINNPNADTCVKTFCNTVAITTNTSSCDPNYVPTYTTSINGNTLTITRTGNGPANTTFQWWGLTIDGLSAIASNYWANTYTHTLTNNLTPVICIEEWWNRNGFGDTCVYNTCDSLNASTINQVNSINNINIYPNPAQNNINVDFESDSQIDAKVIIRDMLGKIVAIENVNVNSNTKTSKNIDINNLTTGGYFVTIEDKTNNNQLISPERFVKQQ